MTYRYKGEVDADGLLFRTDDGRVVFLEAIGESATARTRAIERACDTFSTGQERWSLLGLDVRVPGPMRVEAKEFVAGRTTLRLTSKGVGVVAERWGLAESLLTRSSLSEWAGNRLGRGWTLAAEAAGLVGRRRTPFGAEDAIVTHQPAANQIVLVRSRGRGETWRPRWDWLS